MFSDIQDDTSSAVTLTWSFEDGISRNVWSVDATSTGDFTLGRLQVSLPVVYFYGMRICGEVENVMPEFVDIDE